MHAVDAAPWFDRYVRPFREGGTADATEDAGDAAAAGARILGGHSSLSTVVLRRALTAVGGPLICMHALHANQARIAYRLGLL
jgi:hypothetical protein